MMAHGGEALDFSHATLSDWGWHTAANPEGYRPEDTWIAVASGGGPTLPFEEQHHASSLRCHWTSDP